MMNRVWIGLILSFLVLTGCSTTHRVDLRVTGTAKSAMVTYIDNGSTHQSIEILPWSASTSLSSGGVISGSAQNQGDKGTVSFDVLIDGKVVKSGSASNPYGIASAAIGVPGPDYTTPALITAVLIALMGGGVAATKGGSLSPPSPVQSSSAETVSQEPENVLTQQIDPLKNVDQGTQQKIVIGLFVLILGCVLFAILSAT